MNKKFKVAIAAGAIATAAIGIIAYLKSRIKKSKLDKISASNSGENDIISEAEKIVSLSEITNRSFTYWIPIPREDIHGEEIVNKIKRILKEYLYFNNIVTLTNNPFVCVRGHRLYITGLSPKRSDKSAGEIIDLLDAFYQKYCRPNISGSETAAYELDYQIYMGEMNEQYDADEHDIDRSYESFSCYTDKYYETVIINSPYAITSATLAYTNPYVMDTYFKNQLSEYGLSDKVIFYPDIQDQLLMSYDNDIMKFKLNNNVDICLSVSAIIHLICRCVYYGSGYLDLDDEELPTLTPLNDAIYLSCDKSQTTRIFHCIDDKIREYNLQNNEAIELTYDEDVMEDPSNKKIRISLKKATVSIDLMRDIVAFFRNY